MKNVFIFILLMLAASALYAKTYNLEIGYKAVNFSGKTVQAIAINNQIPGPELRFTEGDDITVHVKNNLDEDTSLHWHGLILPSNMDGVPGLSFDGIKPGETFTYQFKLNQNGTYWYHSHSGFQEQRGVYGAFIIEPKNDDPVQFDREYTIILSDWTDENPKNILKNLKKRGDYYKNPKRTLTGLLNELSDAKDEKQRDFILSERLAFSKMRMDPTDITDVTGYTFLMNGIPSKKGWEGLFKSGEKIRLRFINAAASTYFDVKIPGLKMAVVQADGQNVQSVAVDRFNIAVAETYDIIVQPKKPGAYTIFAESADRSGYTLGTLTSETGQRASVPEMDKPKVLTMMEVMPEHKGHHSHQHRHNHPTHTDKIKTLDYKDLKSLHAHPNDKPMREIQLRLTGDMENYFWSFNNVKYSMAEPLKLELGERVRVTFINETMMHHPLHLHGMWQELDNGQGDYKPLKHTIDIPPKATRVVEINVDGAGDWAFHCHIMYHMATGMFRHVEVKP